MRFAHQILHGLEDAEQNFEQLQSLFANPGTQLPFLQLLSAGRQQIVTGTATLTFSSTPFTATVTVAHNIGRIPVVVLGAGRSTSNFYVVANAIGVTASSLQLTGYAPQAGVPATDTVGVSWAAIG